MSQGRKCNISIYNCVIFWNKIVFHFPQCLTFKFKQKLNLSKIKYIIFGTRSRGFRNDADESKEDSHSLDVEKFVFLQLNAQYLFTNNNREMNEDV